MKKGQKPTAMTGGGTKSKRNDRELDLRWPCDSQVVNDLDAQAHNPHLTPNGITGTETARRKEKSMRTSSEGKDCTPFVTLTQ